MDNPISYLFVLIFIFCIIICVINKGINEQIQNKKDDYNFWNTH